MRSAKGQATIFFILGIVLLAAFAFAFYARTTLSQGRYQREAREAVEAFVNANNIQHYVENTIGVITEEKLRDIGRYGGVLEEPLTYKDVNGNGLFAAGADYLTYTDDEGNPRQVMYATLPNGLPFCPDVSTDPPNYPYAGVPLGQMNANYESGVCGLLFTSGPFGYNRLNKLCYSKGANSAQAGLDNFELICDQKYTSILPNYNIQSQLQATIEEELIANLNFEPYEDTTRSITVDQEGISAEVIYAKDAFHVVATIPFSISLNGKKMVKTTFTFTSPVRLKAMYELLSDELTQDTKEHDDDFFRQVREGTYSYPTEFEFALEQNLCQGGGDAQCLPGTEFDDLLTITDPHVRIDNEAYSITVAIKNRGPALDYIHEEGAGQYDYIAREGESLVITPYGYDPDDAYTYEQLHYEYGVYNQQYDGSQNYGWRQDYMETFDQNRPGCSIPDDLQPCMAPAPFTPNPSGGVEEERWEDSVSYQNTVREARIDTLLVLDRGVHTIRVWTTEDSGLYDYQDVRILVYDLPTANAQESRNTFSDIRDDFASREDPYILSAHGSEGSVLGGEEPTAVQWQGRPTGEAYEFSFRTAIRNLGEIGGTQWALSLPGFPYSSMLFPDYTPDPSDPTRWENPNFYSASGDDVTSVFLTKDIPNNPPRDYELVLRVSSEVAGQQLWSEEDVKAIKIYDCLPTSLNTNPPYPYTQQEPYEHVCCIGGPLEEGVDPSSDAASWGTVASASLDCYSEQAYGSIMDNTFTEITSSHNLFRTIPGTPTNNYYESEYSNTIRTRAQVRGITDLQNDVFQRTFTRYCDNIRGNTCTGNAIIGYHPVDDCNDFDNPQQVERCEGPGSSGSCIQYVSGNSFERTYRVSKRDNGGTADGHCTSDQFCGQTGQTFIFPLAPLSDNAAGSQLCWGGCDGNGDCARAVCTCSQGTCGATCDANHPFNLLQAGNSYTCQHSCNALSCQYQEESCPEMCIHVQQTIFPGTYTGQCQQSHVPQLEQYCHVQTDAGRCYSNGCHYISDGLTSVEERTLRKDYCDTCITSGTDAGKAALAVMPCLSRGSIYTDPFNGDKYCYFSPAPLVPLCTGSGYSCNINYVLLPTCPSNTKPSCNPSIGIGGCVACNPATDPECTS